MMNYYIGLDVGTSSLKAMLITDDQIVAVASRDYPLSFPKPGYAEQDPEEWCAACISAIKELLCGIDTTCVRAISFSGQMHGLVALDENDRVLRPAILWNDGRSVDEVAYLNDTVGKDFLLDNTGNIAFAGFTAPKLLWMKRNEPGLFEKIRKILLPKDYVAFRLSGVFATDCSDAAGTLYFDTKHRRWSKPILDLLEIDETMLPVVHESYETIGLILPELALELGLSDDVKIVIGAGDNAASAFATVNDGDCNISLGTSGTVFVCSDDFHCARDSAIHAFCTANDKYHFLACTLTAASSQKWWVEDIIKSDYSSVAVDEFIGKSDVLFLPYLMGERSPVNDTNVRGVFAGLSMNTTRDEMSLAVLEGVSFSLKQNIEIMRSMGVKINASRVCGGGARNRTWLTLLATILNLDLMLPEYEQGGVLGACLLAAKGCGNDLRNNFCGISEVIHPDNALTEFYEKKYQHYLKLYPMASQLST